MHNITFEVGPDNDLRTINIPIPTEHGKKLLVSVSGGADSAVMLYVLVKANIELSLQHQIYPLTVNKVDGSETHSRKVLDWISKKLGVQINDPIIEGDHTLPHNKIVNTALKQKIASGEFDYIYIGENKIPPIEFPFGEYNDFPGLAPQRKGNPNKNPQIIIPFSDVYKSHTISLYDKLGILELLEYTHSCTERAVGRCGVCWQCGERRWAFKQIGFADPGQV